MTCVHLINNRTTAVFLLWAGASNRYGMGSYINHVDFWEGRKFCQMTLFSKSVQEGRGRGSKICTQKFDQVVYGWPLKCINTEEAKMKHYIWIRPRAANLIQMPFVTNQNFNWMQSYNQSSLSFRLQLTLWR